jgi:hypothetical protein
MFVIGAFLAGVALFLHSFGQPEDNQTAEASAWVTEVGFGSRSGDADACSFAYEFEVGGETFSGYSSANSSSYCSFSEGRAVDVRYDPANPADSKYMDNTFAIKAITIIFQVAALVLWGFAVFKIIQVRRN